MEKGLLEDMLELAKREKARWEKRIQELNAELKKEHIKFPNSTRKAGRPRTSKTAQAEKKIIEILESEGKPLRPREIAEKATKFGTELKPTLVRQILFRLKDIKFISPEPGLWKLKEKQ